ncbi:MAG: class I SAM-dependent DNA methyltransferase [Ignavibacteria bacterium]|nr:class I SAM-dependent DNA methyltransferase [Ignavibacteria bacterium]
MTLSWNEIKDRAFHFSKEWMEARREEAEAKQFLIEFFQVFGISNRKVSTFEHRVKRPDTTDGYIDLLWKGNILIEMKSKGKNLDRAFDQAKAYLHGLPQHELPKYILVSDFDIFRLHDLKEERTIEFKLNEFVHNVHHFNSLIDYQKKVFKEQDHANIKAAELMGKLHDRLKEIGYDGHPLEVYLVRLLFCLFAEDTTIFQKQQFQDYIEQRTNEDGTDLAPRIQELFQVLNTPEAKRFKNLDEQLSEFPYVNGKLFDESLATASFDSKMRLALLECCYQDWSKISPDIFGSMFQSVMNPVERRNLGAHYTSEKNVLKIIKPLFLDELRAEFEACKSNKYKLQEFHRKLANLKFLDPACGCGNILVITYRELRLLELDVLRILYKNELVTSIETIVLLDVDMMYGIEYEEFPARIAEVAMWLIDHQMNMLISNEFGLYFARLPLKKSAMIVHGNALQIDWESVIAKVKLSYILGNPPFVGKSLQNAEQKSDMEKVFTGVKGIGVLDYVTAWYLKAAQYMKNTKIKTAFVSTNSIAQGEQPGILWSLLYNLYKIKIHFAHRTFSWSNEARGNAAVHVVIIGFANYDTTDKKVFEYDDIKGEPHEIKVKNINPYLVEGKDLIILGRTNPINKVPSMVYGSKPVDDGNFFFTDEEKDEFLSIEPSAAKYIKPILSSHEFLNGKNRWCLWLENANPSELKSMPHVIQRLEKVRIFRENSTKESVRKQAKTPSLFSEIRQPKDNFIVIPQHSSETRIYIPFGFFKPSTIVSNSCTALPNASLYLFGVLMSIMHMTWVKNVCGRLESRFRYSNTIVYNNFPWPESPTEKQIKSIETAAQKVLDARAAFPESSLAVLYDPRSMPPALVKAHNELDKAVDSAYRSQPFVNEANRMVFLFELYERYVGGMFVEVKGKGKMKALV